MKSSDKPSIKPTLVVDGTVFVQQECVRHLENGDKKLVVEGIEKSLKSRSRFYAHVISYMSSASCGGLMACYIYPSAEVTTDQWPLRPIVEELRKLHRRILVQKVKRFPRPTKGSRQPQENALVEHLQDHHDEYYYGLTGTLRQSCAKNCKYLMRYIKNINT